MPSAPCSIPMARSVGRLLFDRRFSRWSNAQEAAIAAIAPCPSPRRKARIPLFAQWRPNPHGCESAGKCRWLHRRGADFRSRSMSAMPPMHGRMWWAVFHQALRIRVAETCWATYLVLRRGPSGSRFAPAKSSSPGPIMTRTLIPSRWSRFPISRHGNISACCGCRGSGQFALLDAQGNPFDGNADGTGGDDLVLHWHTKRGRQVRYVDADGDHVTLSLHGPGKLFTIERTRGNPFPILIVEKVQANTQLSGKVVQARFGNGIANIDQLSGISGAAATILNNGQFHVLTVFP